MPPLSKKAAKILAKKRKAEALRVQRKLDHLQREIAAHNLWKDSIDRNLSHAMLKVKVPVQKQQIEVMHRTLDHALDKKESLVQLILKLKHIGNEQYQRTIAGFCLTVDGIMNNFLSDLDNMCKRNENKTTGLLKHGREELEYYVATHGKNETHLFMLLYTGHETADALAWNTRGEYSVRKDEDSSSYLDLYDSLTSKLEGGYACMYNEYKETIKAYRNTTAENTKQVRKLRRKVSEMSDVITAQYKQISSSSKVIKRLSSLAFSYETGEKQASYRERRERHRDACLRLKKSMQEGVKTDSNRLRKLVDASHDSMDFLKAAKEKCEKILRLAALCRKYETCREKVLPFGSRIPQGRDNAIYNWQGTQDPLNVKHIKAESHEYGPFWHKISKAELSKRALIREKIQLERENETLELQLLNRNYENITPNSNKCICNPETMKRPLHQPYAVDGPSEAKKYTRSRYLL